VAQGEAVLGERTLTRKATLAGPRGASELDSILLAVALPTPFKVKGVHDMRWAARGTVYSRHYRIDRGGFDGPLEVSLADRQARHLQGVTGPTITVPAGASEFDYPVQLPPWMETGRTCRVVVMAVGMLKDTDGTEHPVSFSSPQPDDQIILVVEPGRLGVEAERTSILALPGKTVSLPVRVTRGKSLKGDVRVELIPAAHQRGIVAEPLIISADRGQGSLSLRFAADLLGPFNMPVLIRATAMDKGQPVIAETKVEIEFQR